MSRFLPLCLALATALTFTHARADDRADAQAFVDKAKGSLEAFIADPEMIWFRDNVGEAKAVVIIPTMVKGGFIFGGSGGTGVFLSRSSDTSSDWTYPAFYTMGSATFGLQIGGEVSEIILMVMTERGRDAFLTTQFKLGGDVSVAAGPVGAGAKAQTADILAFSRTKGLYGGINIEGAVFKVRHRLNEAYYQPGILPRDILVSRSVSNPGAEPLRGALVRLIN